MIDPGMMAMPVAVETTAEVAVVAEVAGEPVGNEHLAVVAEPMTADGLPANGRALARTGEHKSDRWRATKWHLVYRGHLDHERLLQRVAVATHVPLAAWSVVHRTTEDEGDLTLFGLMFKAGIDVQGKGVFDVPGADGQTSIRPTASTMKSVSWLKSIFEEHRTLPAIGRWQKYPDDNDWGDCIRIATRWRAPPRLIRGPDLDIRPSWIVTAPARLWLPTAVGCRKPYVCLRSTAEALMHRSPRKLQLFAMAFTTWR